MKIGILTFQNTCNYGAALQAYALQSVLREMGHEVSIVNYENAAVTKREEVVKPKASLLASNPRRFFSETYSYPRRKRRYDAFKAFADRCLRIDAPVKGVREIADRYDAVVVGSDQVWNMRLTGNDMTYFLEASLDSGLKAVSYAASFGAAEFPSEYSERCGTALRHFAALSVREVPGIELVRDLSGREASLVLDPTLLASRELWDEMIRKTITETDPYVLVYTVAEREKTLAFAHRAARELGIGIQVIGTANPFALKGARSRSDATVEEFLSLIGGAALVVTSSFHGMALSLALGTNVCYSLSDRPGNSNSRLETLAALAGIENRNISNGLPQSSIDYRKVDAALAIERAKSMAFLQEALSQRKEAASASINDESIPVH